MRKPARPIWYSSTVDGELRELAAEVLSADPSDFVEDILSAVKGADATGRALAADILVNVPDDERIFGLLRGLFAEGDNIPLYASYLGKYGNPAAVDVLTGALETANYMEFLEIGSAIERLGGTVDFDKDWSDDYYYCALKGTK